MKTPRVMIAGTNSGCGKTTLSAGLMYALAKRGKVVQPFKVGPDYIDPMFHTSVTGRHSRNLDSWLLDENTLTHLFCKSSAGSDIAMIEGVMGFYDGFGGRSLEGSSAHVSKILKCPVILVMNAQGMSLSAAALVKGFMDFMEKADIRGVILNRISSHALYLFLKEIIEENTGAKVLGYIPKSEEYVLPERHLGLIPGKEIPNLDEKLEQLGETIAKTIDIALLMKMAEDVPAIEDPGASLYEKYLSASKKETVRIAVAMDSAFHFYYQDNLELLKALGAELVFFSPMQDQKIPDDVDGVYLGGGYPEVFAGELSANIAMRRDVQEKLLKGLPAYAECGGLMYLCRRIKNHGDVFDMAGVFPAQCEMTDRLQRFGYVDLKIAGSGIFARHTTRAHAFHYSTTDMDAIAEEYGIKSCYEVEKHRAGGKVFRWKDGWRIKNTLAGYSHIHFWSNPDLAAEWIEGLRSRRVERCH